MSQSPKTVKAPTPEAKVVKPVKLVSRDPVMWFRRPRGEQGERRGEHNFLSDEHLKTAHVQIDVIGVHIQTKLFHNVTIPWSNIDAFWYEDSEA